MKIICECGNTVILESECGNSFDDYSGKCKKCKRIWNLRDVSAFHNPETDACDTCSYYDEQACICKAPYDCIENEVS